MPYHIAEVIFRDAKRQPCNLTGIRFDNVTKTPKDALLKETAELYRSRTLDELIIKAHIASKHMEVS